jgi:phosphoglycolate phosphatase-like HAD superfamily hydrolase
MSGADSDAAKGNFDRLRALLPGARFVFDWNGTIVDDAERTLVALNATLADLGMSPLDDDAFRHAFCLPMEGFLRDIGVSASRVTSVLIDWQRGIEEREAPLASGVVETLRALSEQGRPAGVISAGFTAGVERDAARLGIRQWLVFLHGSVRSKSTVLRKVMQPGQTLIYIGDTEYDMREAVIAGAVPVGFAGGYRPTETLIAAGAIATIEDFRVLLEER